MATQQEQEHEHEHDHEHNGSPNIDNLTPEEASRIIHSHRKVRYGMSLGPWLSNHVCLAQTYTYIYTYA